MDIDRIRYFMTFSSTGSLVRAAEILHISQPALSKALRVLEAEINLKLLEADGRGLRLTDVGQKFRDKVRPLLREWLDVAEAVRNDNSHQPVRLTSFEVFTTYFLGHLLHQGTIENLEVLENGPGKMERAVSEGKADIGITYIPVPLNGVEFTEVTKIRMGVFGLSKFKESEFNKLQFVTPILPLEGLPSKILGLDGWPDDLIPRKVRFRVTMMESAMELCRIGHAVAYLPEFVVELHNERMLKDHRLEQLKSPLANKHRYQSVYLIRRVGSQESPFERGVAKGLRALK